MMNRFASYASARCFAAVTMATAASPIGTTPWRWTTATVAPQRRFCLVGDLRKHRLGHLRIDLVLQLDHHAIVIRAIPGAADEGHDRAIAGAGNRALKALDVDRSVDQRGRRTAAHRWQECDHVTFDHRLVPAGIRAVARGPHVRPVRTETGVALGHRGPPIVDGGAVGERELASVLRQLAKGCEAAHLDAHDPRPGPR